jgi:mannose-6-phosphate isomerase-like protein (cupin superfamily)
VTAQVQTLEDLRSSSLASLFEGRHHGGAEVSFFVTDAPPGRGPVLHLHPYPEVFIVEQGEATFTAGEEQTVVGAGHVVVVPAETPHRFENTGEGTLHVVSIHPSGEVVQTDL